MTSKPRRLAYADSDKEAPARSLAREDSFLEQRTSTLKKFKKAGRPEHNQGEKKEGKGPSLEVKGPDTKKQARTLNMKKDRGHNTNDCYQLKKKIEEAVASGKLAHLAKDIRQNNQRNGSQERNNIKVINMIMGRGSLKRPFERERSGLTDELTFLVIPRNQLTDETIILEGMIEDHQCR
ncbi:hypothetical protein Tco_0723824 [Tanacetum coccineum]